MEKLIERLNALQTDLMDIYESDCRDLETCIRKWKLERQENGILFCAKKAGCRNVGMTAVPSSQISEAKTKQCIEMQLHLEGLQNCGFGSEPWTLAETSFERFFCTPTGTFKKNGRHVTVQFSGGHEQDYVVWGDIYVYSKHNWTKTTSHVDHKGIYYDLEGRSEYYVDFQKESNELSGENGTWMITGDNNINFMCSDSEQPVSAITEQTQDSQRPSTPGRGDLGSSEAKVPDEADGPWRPWPCNTQAAIRRRDGREGPAKRPRGRPPGPRGINYGPNQRWTLNDNCLPTLVLKGEPNKLKCLRYRITKDLSKLYLCISSTWHWTGGSPDKPAHVTIVFKDREQRARFVEQVRVPPNILCCLGLTTL